MESYQKDDEIAYYIYDKSVGKWYKTEFRPSTEMDLFASEIEEFKIRELIHATDLYYDSLIVRSSQGLWRTLIETDVLTFSSMPLFYAVEVFRKWDLYKYQDVKNQNIARVPFGNYPAIEIISVYEFDKYLDQGNYIYDEITRMNSESYFISADKQYLVCLKSHFNWRQKSPIYPEDEEIYYEVRYLYKASIAFAEGLLSANVKIAEADHVGNVAAKNSQMKADELGFQLLNNLQPDSYTFYYGTDYEDWNYQHHAITSGLPYTISEADFEESTISSVGAFSTFTEFGNTRMNYGTISHDPVNYQVSMS